MATCTTHNNNKVTDFKLFYTDETDMLDLKIENGDFVVTGGLETAVDMSILIDRRAEPHEVSLPEKRRGWIGDTLKNKRYARLGSGLWLYNQRRVNAVTRIGVDNEVRASLSWLLDSGFCSKIEVITEAEGSTIFFEASLTSTSGGVQKRQYRVFNNTKNRL